MGESDILPPSEIEAILRDYQARVGQVPLNATERNVGRLLSHLRALVAPADGEALGRDLYLAIHGHATGRIFDTLPCEARTRMNEAALHLRAIGHAAGALSREGEIAALRSESAQHLAMAKNEARKGMEAEATIAHLAAELAEARGLILRNAETIRQLEANVYSTEKSRAAARADGAREEREAIDRTLSYLASGAQSHAEKDALGRAIDAIRARGGR